MRCGIRLLLTLTGIALITLLTLLIVQQNPPVEEEQLFNVCDQKILNSNVNFKQGSIKTYEDLEKELCKSKLIKYRDTQKQLADCPDRGIVSMMAGGRTGNHMWEYISIWINALETGLIPYVPFCIWNTVDSMFQNLSLRPMQDISHCPVQHQFVANLTEWSCMNQSLIIGQFKFEKALLVKWINEARHELEFKTELKENAQRIIRELVNGSIKYTFVAIHVRRTDYEEYLNRKFNLELSKSNFYSHAMDYYRSKYKNCIFLFISDDPTWCYEQFGNLQDVRVVSYNSTANSPAEDMALMAASNHSVFDYGTFGRWGAILAGGEVVYLDMIQNNIIKQFFTSLNWVGLD